MFGQQSPSADDETPDVVREAWRARLLDDVAEKSAERRRNRTIRDAAVLGTLLGIVGSVAIYWN